MLINGKLAIKITRFEAIAGNNFALTDFKISGFDVDATILPCFPSST